MDRTELDQPYVLPAGQPQGERGWMAIYKRIYRFLFRAIPRLPGLAFGRRSVLLLEVRFPADSAACAQRLSHRRCRRWAGLHWGQQVRASAAPAPPVGAPVASSGVNCIRGCFGMLLHSSTLQEGYMVM